MDEIESKIRRIESAPEEYVDQAMEGELEIPNVAQDVYEAFLYFYFKELQSQLTGVNMRYDGQGSKIILAGPCENLHRNEAFVKHMLQELTDRMHVDTIPLPNLENSVLQSMVTEIQPLFKEALLFVPVADHFNGVHIIALSSEDAQRVKRSTMEKISHNPDTTPRKTTISASRQCPIPVDFRSDIHTFITEQNIQVLVYKENILNLPVSCIVNAANEYLQHGSGVAFAILQAAGESFDLACKEHIKRNGLVRVGTCAETVAGDLPYACVINAVGPRWDPAKESLCKTQLHSAVESSIVKAAQLGMDSIGIPAISSGEYFFICFM
jgi:O-acetyl-ADP-ribose deacetylase (regulator of RNase III)